MLVTQSLSFSYNSDTHFNFPDISLQSNEDLLILGPSGVGKTTLLHLIGGLLTPSSGEINIGNIALDKLSHSKRDAFRGKYIGVVFQKARFIQSLSVTENIKAKCFFAGVRMSTREINSLLDELGLLQQRDKKVTRLSEGQKQRLSIAIAIANKPQLILADEPTASLDKANADNVMRILQEQARSNKANLLVITHDERIRHHFEKMLQL